MIGSYYNSLAAAAFTEFWTLNILKTSNLLTNAFEAIGSQIPRDGEETGNALSPLGNHVRNHCWLIHRASNLNYGSTYSLYFLTSSIGFDLASQKWPLCFHTRKSKIFPYSFFRSCQRPETNP